MKIHREGYIIILVSFILLALLNFGAWFLFGNITWLLALFTFAELVFFILIVQFFRVPKRKFTTGENIITAPADGKLVVIEEVFESEYFNDKRIQVSIFMSPLNVHVNRYPVSGKVKYVKYHPGKYLVAWHPKSSTENERTTVVVDTGKHEIMMRQIAGAVARRIVCYSKTGDVAQQCEEMGFIKFGSRVDLLLPLDCKITANIGDIIVGSVTEIARFE